MVITLPGKNFFFFFNKPMFYTIYKKKGVRKKRASS